LRSMWVIAETDKVAQPVDLYLLVRIVNLQPIEAAIDSFRVEALNSSGSWTPLKFVVAGGQWKLVMGTRKSAYFVTVKPPGIYEVISNPIGPGKTIRGTALCEVPGGDLSAFKMPMQFRIVIRDTADRVFTIDSPESPAGFGESESSEIISGKRSIDLSRFTNSREK
jgi:hypothetical protein